MSKPRNQPMPVRPVEAAAAADCTFRCRDFCRNNWSFDKIFAGAAFSFQFSSVRPSSVVDNEVQPPNAMANLAMDHRTSFKRAPSV